MMKELSIEEIHSIILEIAKAFDKLCTKYGIPYYMLGGTMLGAIRHQGFIPWDDDMDFGVPRQYYGKLMNVLIQELPAPYRCSTYKNHPGVYSPFFKIEDTTTVIVDKKIPVTIDKQLGVNIDIFPLDYCENGNPIVKKVMWLGRLYQYVYVVNPNGEKIKNICKCIARKIFPLSRVGILDQQVKLLESLPEGSFLANVFGRWKEREIIPVEWYGNATYCFEGLSFRGLEKYDLYLRQLYGDYMRLPPIEQRKAHVENVYKK